MRRLSWCERISAWLDNRRCYHCHSCVAYERCINPEARQGQRVYENLCKFHGALHLEEVKP